MPNSLSANDIQRQMSQIRCDLHTNVRGIVENAKVIADWKYYVRRYPWACLAGVAALGYLAVPRRLEILRPDLDTLAELAKTNRLIVHPQPQSKPHGGTAASLFTFLANTILPAAMGHVGRQVGRILRAQAEHPAQKYR